MIKYNYLYFIFKLLLFIIFTSSPIKANKDLSRNKFAIFKKFIFNFFSDKKIKITLMKVKKKKKFFWYKNFINKNYNKIFFFIIINNIYELIIISIVIYYIYYLLFFL